jgi:hypothetical protein
VRVRLKAWPKPSKRISEYTCCSRPSVGRDCGDDGEGENEGDDGEDCGMQGLWW